MRNNNYLNHYLEKIKLHLYFWTGLYNMAFISNTTIHSLANKLHISYGKQK
jgi:hypothetical protein